MSKKNKEIVQKVNAAFAENKMEDFLSLCAEGFEWNLVGEKTIEGKEAVREFLSSMETTDCESPLFTVDKMIAEGDSVICYGDMLMKEKGENVPYSFCDVYQIKNDEIVRLQSFIVKHKTEGENEQKAAA